MGAVIILLALIGLGVGLKFWYITLPLILGGVYIGWKIKGKLNV